MNKIALLFPGQDVYRPGAGKLLIEQFQVARYTFEEASDALGTNLVQMHQNDEANEPSQSEITQSLLLTYSIAAFRVLREIIGQPPAVGAGHSLGEISALTCAGSIKFWDALDIVSERERLMYQIPYLNRTTMVSVIGVHHDIVEEECRRVSEAQQIVSVACMNLPNNTIISGYREAVEQVCLNLSRGHKVKTIPLQVKGAFHSPIMQPVAYDWSRMVGSQFYNPLEWPIVSGLTAKPYEGPEQIKSHLLLQTTKRVRWFECMDYLLNCEIDSAVELGPGEVLTDLFNHHAGRNAAFSICNREGLKRLYTLMQRNLPVGEKQAPFVSRCLANAVSTKNRNHDERAYETGVLAPYRKLKAIQEKVEKSGGLPSPDQLRDSFENLTTIFSTKMVPISEQTWRLEQLCMETDTLDYFHGTLSKLGGR